MRTNSIPIILLTGFLGSGKTSLLNNLLQNNQNLKIGVIINDFGKINIDSMLVSAQTDTALELSNGCICCSLEDDNLDNALGQLAHKGSRLDYIVVEASGIAEVRELATMLRVLKNNYCHFDTLVNIVDGENFKQNNLNNPNALTDLEITDLIVINKVDLINNQELTDIKDGIKLVAPQARLVEATHGQFDFRLLLDPDITDKPSAQLKLSQQHDHHQHLHDKFTSLSFEADKPLDPAKFDNWIKNLDTDIFRAKGIIFFGMKGVGQKFIFQLVGRRHQLKITEWGFDETPKTSLVIIGINLNKQILTKQFESLIDQEPDNITSETLMDIFLYK